MIGEWKMNDELELMKSNLIVIATELFRVQRVFNKAMSKLEIEEQNK